MKRNIFKQGSLVLIVAAGTIAPYTMTMNVDSEPSQDLFVIRSICLLPNNEKLLVKEVANIADALIVESQKTVNKMLDSLDKTPLSYFSNHMKFLIDRIKDVSATLTKHSKELPDNMPKEFSESIKLSVDLLGIVTKYLNKVHAILVNPKLNTKALKLAKALEKSQGMLEKSFLKCSKKLVELIKKLEILGLDEQAEKLELLKELVDEARDLIINPTPASMAQNLQMVNALNKKIEAESKLKAKK